MGNFFQRQAMAVPANMSDPLLKKWVKPTTNPFLVQVCCMVCTCCHTQAAATGNGAMRHKAVAVSISYQQLPAGTDTHDAYCLRVDMQISNAFRTMAHTSTLLKS